MNLARPYKFPLTLALAIALLVSGGALSMSLEEAVDTVRDEQVDARVLSAQTVRLGKRSIHRIKVLTQDGRVKIIQIPADRERRKKVEEVDDEDSAG